MALSEWPIDVSDEALRRGFELAEHHGEWIWVPAAADEWPSFSTREEACGWMEEALRDGKIIEAS